MYFAGFNKLVDWFGVFIVAVLVKLKLHAPAGRLLCWAINTFYKPPDLSFLVLEAGGEKNGRPVRARVTLEHVDAYDFTAIPVVACLKQYMDEQIPPGLHLQAIAVEPQRFMADMQAMGVKVETTLS